MQCIQVLDLWVQVQRKWMYLEGIFIGGDIRAQLPDEAHMFDEIDKKFHKFITDAVKNPIVKSWCTASGRISDLQSMMGGLDKCQKSLNDYLDSKRNAFPRFFFISDDELLSILGSSEPTCVQVTCSFIAVCVYNVIMLQNSFYLHARLYSLPGSGVVSCYRLLVD